MKQYFFFDTMIVPQIITGIYWLGLVGAVIGGIIVMFTRGGITGILAGLITMAGTALLARIYSELMIVLFKINDNIRKLVDKN
jgi:hypothetical protein